MHRVRTNHEAAFGERRSAALAAFVACLAGCATIGGSVPSAHPLATGAVLATIPVGTPPTLLAISPDGSRVFAASSGELAIIRTDTNTVAATASITPYTSGVAVTPDGRRVLVTNSSAASLTVVDAESGMRLPSIPLVLDIPPGGFGRIAVSPDGRRAYVVNPPKAYLAVVDLDQKSTTQSLQVLRPSDVTLGGNGTTLYLTGCQNFCTTGTVQVMDPA